MLIDMTGGARDREIVFDRIGQVLSPSWSPDGQSIVFSALAGGLTDLYACDLATGQLRQLTDDAFADLQPAWSHDGRTIAFVTERFSSHLDALQFGRPQLAVMDVETRAVRAVPLAAGNAHLNPQWSTDDRDLYFVADLDGTMNIYRTALETGMLWRITNVDTGVSGITPTSPVFSVADGASSLAFTVYERGRPRLVVLAERAALDGEVFDAPIGEAYVSDAAAEGVVDSYLADSTTGLAQASSIENRRYLSR